MSEEYVTKSQDPNINLKDIADINYSEHQRLLSDVVERQIQNFIDLDHNLFDEDVLSNNTLADVLLYTDKNYISIPGIETVLVDPTTLNKIGRYVYELFTVELLNFIIPEMLLTLGINDPTDLISNNYDTIKVTLHQVVAKKRSGISDVYLKSGNQEMYDQLLKWTFYQDLFDANLEDFIERVLTILVNDYDVKIFTKLIRF